MFKKSKRSPPSAGWLIGMAVSLTGLLLTVSSMDYAPITPVKLLITALFMTGIAVTTRRLRYKQPDARHKANTSDHKQQKIKQPDVAA